MMLRFTVPALLLALLSHGLGQNSADSLQKGNEAMDARLWEVAVTHYQEGLNNKTLDATTKSTIAIHLAEAWIRDGMPAKALDLLGQPFINADPQLPFWKGQALAALGQFAKAVEILSPLAQDPKSPYRHEAGFTAASLQLALGQPDAALTTLTNLNTTPDPKWASKIRLRQAQILLDVGKNDDARDVMPKISEIEADDKPLATFLTANILLRSGHLDDAIANFQSLLDEPQNQSVLRYHAAVIGLADSLRAKENPSAAADVLLNFIQDHQDSPMLEEMFKRLLLLIPEAPTLADPILERLAQWIPPADIPSTGLIATADCSAASAWPAEATTNDLLAFSLFTRASGLHRLNTPATKDEARSLIHRLRLENPRHFLSNRALLIIALWDQQEDRIPQSLHILQTLRDNATSPLMRSEAAFLQAHTAYDQGDKSQAIAIYQETAEHLTGIEADTARFNAALIQITDPGSSSIIKPGEIKNRDMASALQLERAMALTAPNDKRNAIDTFLIEHPDHPRATEARILAAEISLIGPQPDISYARAQIETLESQPEELTKIPAVHFALIKIRLSDLAGDTTATIAATKALVEKFPNTPEAEEASFILGRNLYQTRNYNDARIVMEKLTAKVTNPAHAQAAWLLAARSAALVPTSQSQQEALALFDKAISTDSPVSALAKLEKARLMIDMSRLSEATEFLRTWFSKLNENDPLYLPAGMLLGESIYAQGNVNPKSLTQALEIYDQLLKHTETFSANYDRLQYLRGRTLEQLPDTENPNLTREKNAFIAYYSVLERTTPPEQWHYFEMAGFRALALLEKAHRWPAAIVCAKKIASFNGPRANEASTRASQIQLKHMIWED